MTEQPEVAKTVARRLRWGTAVVGPLIAAALVLGTTFLHAATHSVELTITANKSASGGLAFNGYQRGAMTITVPAGWQVVVHFENTDSTAHSLAVLSSGAHTQMAPPSGPAFAGAATPNFSTGVAKGSQQTFTFEASKPGTYEFVCGVAGHAISGQWDTLVVSASADAPSATPAGAAALTVK